jgi:hypothetical protein
VVTLGTKRLKHRLPTPGWNYNHSRVVSRYLCCWLLHPVFCNTLLHLNAHFLIRNAVRLCKKIAESALLSVPLVHCSCPWWRALLSEIQNSAVRHLVQGNESMTKSRSQFPVHVRRKLNKMSTAFHFQNASRIYRVPTTLPSTWNWSENVRARLNERHFGLWKEFVIVITAVCSVSQPGAYQHNCTRQSSHFYSNIFVTSETNNYYVSNFLFT